VDSAVSSAANLGLSLLAGRILGPDGLGTLVVGFSVYLAMVSLQRSLVTTPLVSSSSALSPDARADATRAALTTLVVLGAAATAVVAGIALLASGAVARGLLVVVPWLLPSMVQDFWRATLFRDGRPGAAALTTSFRLVTMIVLAPLAWAAATEAAVAAAWGAGFLVATVAGFLLTRLVPAGGAPALRWWRGSAWPFGRWLVAQESIFTVANYAITFILIGLIGAYGMGGLRAAESAFAPLSLLAPAIALPGLPALARAGERGYDTAWALAVRLTLATVGLTFVYFATMLVIGTTLLVLLYGGDFRDFSSLLVPISAWQIVSASALGFTLLLSSAQRGRALLVSGTVNSCGQLVLITLLAWTHGVTGAAWGLALGSAIGAGVTIWLASR
jgi:O-antigen/teichoic acid export membrane protein